MYQKKAPEDRIGHAHRAGEEIGPITRGRSRRKGIPIPEPSPDWKPAAQSWFRSLRLSGQSDFYEASDWATAVAAAQAYDIFLRTWNASVFTQFLRLSERLGVTVVDRAKARIVLDDGDGATDTDEDAAARTVIEWQGKLGVVRETGDGDPSD